MNNSELVAKIAQNTGWTKVSVAKFLQVLEDVSMEELDAGGSVKIGGVKLETYTSPARKGYNLQTGQPMTIPSSRRVRVGLSAALKRLFKNE